MRDFLNEIADHANDPALSDPDPVRRAQIQMKRPLPKRFYKDVTVAAGEDGRFAIHLDGRSVKTPARNALSLPAEALAKLVAAEWMAQESEIDPAKMPVTRLVNTALDGIASDPQAVLDDIARFAGTDLICYRADGPEALVARQGEGWDPVIAWAASAIGARFILAEGIVHQEQPAEAIAAFTERLQRHREPVAIACLHTLTTLTGSALLALAFAESRLDADAVWALAHIDEDWTIEHWGEDAEASARRGLREQEMRAAAAAFEALRT